MTEPILTVRNVSKVYGGVHALQGVSLTVEPGSITGLIGPNGAGKTTLMDVITGTQKASTGEVFLTGSQLRGGAARRAARGLARTFQHPLLSGELTVLENILVGVVARRQRTLARTITELLRGTVAGVRRDDAATAIRLAEQFGLDRWDRSASELTLGEQRLVEVARAQAQQSQVLLLDEPFAGSDARGVAGIVEAVEGVRSRGHGVLLIDHNVDLVCRVADRVVLLEQGTVRFVGTPQECLASTEMHEVYFGEEAGPENAPAIR